MTALEWPPPDRLPPFHPLTTSNLRRLCQRVDREEPGAVEVLVDHLLEEAAIPIIVQAWARRFLVATATLGDLQDIHKRTERGVDLTEAERAIVLLRRARVDDRLGLELTPGSGYVVGEERAFDRIADFLSGLDVGQADAPSMVTLVLSIRVPFADNDDDFVISTSDWNGEGHVEVVDATLARATEHLVAEGYPRQRIRFLLRARDSRDGDEAPPTRRVGFVLVLESDDEVEVEDAPPPTTTTLAARARRERASDAARRGWETRRLNEHMVRRLRRPPR